ncbi:MAG: GntR family transcriptional regulator, partial [Anaerolineae bacterium]|nr:GntR family transcriptional regulator [Anaerolineae bacterium]
MPSFPTGPQSARRDAGASLTMAAAADLGRRIVGRQIPAGSALPTEPELQEQLGVSRTVVREAIRHLASKGLVSVGPKVGTRVRPPSDWNMLDPQVMEWHMAGPASADFIAALYEMRFIFEPEAARLAATRISPAQREALASALEGIT